MSTSESLKSRSISIPGYIQTSGWFIPSDANNFINGGSVSFYRATVSLKALIPAFVLIPNCFTSFNPNNLESGSWK